MTKLNQPYTLGIWTVKTGKEKVFVEEWQSFAKWTAQHQPGAGVGHLLQDPEHIQQFISYGSWESVDAIMAWRECPEFKAFGSKIRELCADFQPRSLVLVASSEF